MTELDAFQTRFIAADKNMIIVKALEGMPDVVVVFGMSLNERNAQSLMYFPIVYAKKDISTDDGIVGHAVCCACGETVHMRDAYCWNCGAKFENVG